MALSIGFRIVSFLPSCYSSYGALDFYPGGTLTHWLMPAFTGRTLFITYRNVISKFGSGVGPAGIPKGVHQTPFAAALAEQIRP